MNTRYLLTIQALVLIAAWRAGPALAAPLEPPQRCKPSAGVLCDEGELCELPVGSCQADAIGLCQDTPDTCDHTYKPVCGCDGKTYPNACMARLFGMSIRGRGECPEAGHASQALACELSESAQREVQQLFGSYQIPIPPGDLFFCYGWDDEVHQCLLYAGSEAACDRLEPCWTALGAPSIAVVSRLPPEADTFCQGWNSDSGQCHTYYGSAALCATLEPCPAFAQMAIGYGIELPDPYFCYGIDPDDDLAQCKLLLASKATCEAMLPCW